MNLTFTRCILSLIVFFCINISLLPADNQIISQEAQSFLATMSTKLENLKSLESSFSQERHMPALQKPLISKGKCFFKSPDKLRWETRTHYRSILIYNGRKIILFEEKDGKLDKKRLPSSSIMRNIMVQIAGWMKGQFNQEGLYQISLAQAPAKKKVILLLPRHEKMRENIQEIKLIVRLSDYSVEEVHIKQAAGERLIFRFLDQKRNSSLANWVFDTRDPLP